jgi:hypothetical protein
VLPCWGKKPVGKIGLHHASTLQEQVASWWQQWPAANIGLAVTPGRIVLDIDPRHGGDASLQELERAHGALPETLTALTGGGGTHYWFAVQAGSVRNKAPLGEGIDVQGPGSYVIAPPSIHLDTGQSYRWDAGMGPESCDIEPAPAWLLTLLTSQQRRTQRDAERTGNGTIPEGRRETTLLALAGAMQRQGASPAAIRSALEAENARCVPPLDDADLDRMTRSVGRYTPAPTLYVGAEGLTPIQKLWMHGDNATPQSLQILRAYWHGDITGAWRSGKEPATWWIRLSGQEICLGSTMQLQDQKHIRACFLEATGHMPPVIPPKRAEEWDACLRALAALALARDEPENDPANQARELVKSYLDSKPYKFQMDFDAEEWQQCARNNQPFRCEGSVYIHCRQWHIDYLRHFTDVTYAEALAMLRKLGTNTLIRLMHPNTSRYYWKIPGEGFADVDDN